MYERARAWFGVFATLLALSLPSAADAQVLGTVAGNVKDASGAVLPGVTVEASSPALIEKVRTAVTDGNGQYRIVNLPPGVYSVTFTLPGFAIVKRDALDVSHLRQQPSSRRDRRDASPRCSLSLSHLPLRAGEGSAHQ